jgi:hypothetical protein
MSAEVTIAAASLIFASIAFIVAFVQLLQSIFGHVEGFRRCAESSVGDWHQFRRRRPIPLELRIEVTYETPHFMVLASEVSDWTHAEAAFGDTYDLATLTRPVSDGPGRRAYEGILRGLVPPGAKKSDQSLLVPPRPPDVEKNAQQEPSSSWIRRTAQSPLLPSLIQSSDDSNVKEDTRQRERHLGERASWLALLIAVRNAYSFQYQASFVPEKHEHNEEHSDDALHISIRGGRAVSLWSLAAISFRRWSWDCTYSIHNSCSLSHMLTPLPLFYSCPPILPFPSPHLP